MAVLCFIPSRTILTKISIFLFPRVLPEIILYRTENFPVFCSGSKIEGEIFPTAESCFTEDASFVELWHRHFVLKKKKFNCDYTSWYIQ